jgi:hypothetical protein
VTIVKYIFALSDISMLFNISFNALNLSCFTVIAISRTFFLPFFV